MVELSSSIKDWIFAKKNEGPNEDAAVQEAGHEQA